MKESAPKRQLRYRHYSEQYKHDAVELWQSSGRTAAAIAHELGIRREFLYKWQHQQRPTKGEGAAAAPSPAALQRENQALREEVERLREQRDILKKSLGILSEPPVRGMPKSKR